MLSLFILALEALEGLAMSLIGWFYAQCLQWPVVSHLIYHMIGCRCVQQPIFFFDCIIASYSIVVLLGKILEERCYFITFL